MPVSDEHLAKMIRCAPLLPSPGDLDEDGSLEFKAMQGAMSALG